MIISHQDKAQTTDVSEVTINAALAAIRQKTREVFIRKEYDLRECTLGFHSKPRRRAKRNNNARQRFSSAPAGKQPHRPNKGRRAYFCRKV